MQRKILVATCGLIQYWSADDTFRMIHEAGFDGVDWNIPILSGWDREAIKRGTYAPGIFAESVDEMLRFYRPQLDAAEKYGVEIRQIHAPFPCYVQDFPEFCDLYVEVAKKTIRFCEQVGARNVVVHGASLALTDGTQSPASIAGINDHLYAALVPTLQKTHVTVCLENLFTEYQHHVVAGVCTDPEEADSCIDRYNEMAGRECFGLCFDTGHQNLIGGNQRTYIQRVGKRLKALHIHDNNGDFDAHLMPYAGNIRWEQFLQGLKDVGYSGDLSFETVQQPDIHRGVQREAVPVLLKAIHDIGVVFAHALDG